MSRLTNVKKKKKNPKQLIVVKDCAGTFQYGEIYESRICATTAERYFKNHSTSEQGFEE